MDIQIESNVQFNEVIYDAAFGLAKRMISSEGQKIVKRKYGVIYEVYRKKNGGIVAKIWEE